MAFTRLSSNVLRVFVINSIGDFVLFLGKIAVVLLTVVAGSELLKTKTIHNMWMILILAGIFAYMIAHTFITVYEVLKIIVTFARTINANLFLFLL